MNIKKIFDNPNVKAVALAFMLAAGTFRTSGLESIAVPRTDLLNSTGDVKTLNEAAVHEVTQGGNIFGHQR